MARTPARATWWNSNVLLTGTVILVSSLAALYWAQVVFIPLALAIFLAFLLTPLVRRLQNAGVGRVPSVLLVVTVVTLLLIGLGWILGSQVAGLAADLPNYTENMKAKARSLRDLGAGPLTENLDRIISDLSAEFGIKSAGQPKRGDEAEPVPVVIKPETPAWLGSLPGYLNSILEILGGMALALILLIFLLLNRENMRNRFLRLVGERRLSYTTRALADASHRISRYLQMQLIINATYGMALAAGLLVIGVDYAILWGVIAAILRYIPYVGPWIAALFPVTLSLALFDTWWPPLAVISYVLVLELISNNYMEPRLYGQTIGVSEVGLLVCAAFWTFLWGPIGLVLSAPLTVCMVVAGKYVPRLKFLDILLGDDPPLPPEVSLYQRLLANDFIEAKELVGEQLKKKDLEPVRDEFFVPILRQMRRDLERGELSEKEEAFIFESLRTLLHEVNNRELLLAEAAKKTKLSQPPPVERKKVRLLSCPGHDEIDRLALEMLHQLLEPRDWQIEVIGVNALTGEVLDQVGDIAPDLICIGSLAPSGVKQVRLLCKRLRSRFPELKIIVGRRGENGKREANALLFKEDGADEVTATLLETRNALKGLVPVVAEQPSSGAADQRRLTQGGESAFMKKGR